jgi:putative adhesin
VVIVAIVAVISAGVLVMLSVSDTSVVRTTHRGVTELVVTAHSEDITLVAAPADAPVRVTRHVTQGLHSPRRVESFAGGRLTLGFDCTDWPLDRCGIRYEIAVPPGTSVVATSGDGDVVANGLTSRGALDLQSGSGDIVATGVSARRLTLQSGSGDVTGDGVSADSLSLESGSGDIVLEVTEPGSNLTVEAGSGDVIAELPDDVSYALDLSSPDEGVFNDGVRDDPRSPHRVQIETGSGELRLEPR